jgi:PhzF family phenazine biosynthesis protein
MELKIYQVDAFTDHLFGGNPAAVVPLKKWLPTETMQQLALENNLSETVFFVASPNPSEGGALDPNNLDINEKKQGFNATPLEGLGEADFDIRWFTPGVEINLCGHATLAAAYVLFNKLGFAKETLTFSSKSGLLSVVQEGEKLIMDFPSWKPSTKAVYPELLQAALGGVTIKEVHQYRDWLVVLEDEASVKNCLPDFSLMKKIEEKIIITAKGDSADFVSRFFAPTAGVDEDPVTGSAHSQLIPFWNEKLGKTSMTAKQLSHRGGDLFCSQLNNERVSIGGQCVFYMEGTFRISDV